MSDIKKLLPPSELELCKQDLRRDPTTFRQRFFDRNKTLLSDNPMERTLVFGDRAHRLADDIEAYYATLPNWGPRVHTKGRFKGERY